MTRARPVLLAFLALSGCSSEPICGSWITQPSELLTPQTFTIDSDLTGEGQLIVTEATAAGLALVEGQHELVATQHQDSEGKALPDTYRISVVGADPEATMICDVQEDGERLECPAVLRIWDYMHGRLTFVRD